MKIKISICIVLFLIAKVSYQCTLPELEIGNTCMTQAEIDECNEHLGQLDAVGDAIDNICETETIQYTDYSLFSIESRMAPGSQLPGEGQQFANNLRNTFNNSPLQPGYCKRSNPVFPFNNWSLCQGPSTNLIWKWDLQWNDSQGANYEFQFGIDFGLGSALWVDGNLVFNTKDDLWWLGNYYNPNEIITYSGFLSAGVHHIELIGHEGCCDGLQSAQFKRNGNGPYELSYQNMSDQIPQFSLQTTEILIYNFSINYNAPFYFDSTDCLEQTLFFHFQQLNSGPAILNEWEFDSLNQEINFSIAHRDLMELYNCDYYPSDDEYFWQCQVDLNIIFAGETQLTYSFLIQITLSRLYTDELNLTIVKNEVIGDCCENELNIDTTLRYCTDLSCNTYLPDGLVIERLQSFFIEHSIVTQEFQYYYLHFVQIKIGPFIPDIISYDGSQQGRIMYELQSNIALANQVLQSIVRLDENPSRRRFLVDNPSSEEVGDEYRVKATKEVTVIVQIERENNESSERKDKEEESNNTPLIIIVSVLTGVIVLGAIGGVVYCVKMRDRQDTESEFAKTEVVVQYTA